MSTVKLKASRLFFDKLTKRHITQGVMFFASKERALQLVDGGFADIVDREPEVPTEAIISEDTKQPEPELHKPTEIEDEVKVEPEVKPVVSSKPVQAKAPVTKKTTTPVAKKSTTKSKK